MEHKRRKRDDRSPDLRFILRGNKRGLLTLAGLALIAAFCETFLLAAIVQSVSALSKGQHQVDLHVAGARLTTSITSLLVAAVVAAVIRGLLTMVVALTGPRIAARSRERHRVALFAAYLGADWSTQSADKTGRFLQTLQGSVNDANSIILLTTQAVPAAITLTVLLTVALIINPLITGSIVLLGVLIGSALRPISRTAHRSARADARGRTATAGHVAGVLTSGAEIAVLGSEAGVLQIGRDRIHTAESSFARAQGLKRVVSSSGQSISLLCAAAGLLALSASSADINFTTVGTVTVLLLRSASLSQTVQTAASQYGTVAPFIEQIRLLLDHYHQHRRSFGDRPFPERFDIVVDDVSYAYPGTERAAVRVRHARFAQGSSVAILGPSGSGKSTLMQLVLRLRAPGHGGIHIGGIPAWSISEEAFSERVAYVPQAPHLVPSTILENIRFFRPHVTEEAIHEAARQAHLHDDILAMDEGYDTLLDSHVDKLSGGQKQRLALARALVTGPAVLVLDEPTSALDAANETAILATLKELTGRTTVIMVTHKLSTASDCDTVLELSAGELVERPVGEEPAVDALGGAWVSARD